MSTLTLVLTAVGSVLLLLFLVMKARMHAFVALMVVSIGAGLFSGMPLDKIAATMEKGMGGTLGFLAIVVALGAMFGKILHETGAVDQIAVKMLVKILRVDVDKCKDIGKAYEVQGVPVFRVFKNGQTAWSHTGIISCEELKAVLLKNL